MKAVTVSGVKKVVGVYNNSEIIVGINGILTELAEQNCMEIELTGNGVMLNSKKVIFEEFTEDIFYNYSIANTAFIFLEGGIL